MRGSQVYLAGPISGLTHGECTDWREKFRLELLVEGIECFSPMRGKEYLANVGKIEGSYDFDVMATPRGIMTRDFWDCTTCDALLVNLLGAERISVGTVMELAWAYQSRIPVVCVMEEGNLHEHPMVSEAIGFLVRDLHSAKNVLCSMFVK